MGKRMICMALILLVLTSCKGRTYFQIGGSESSANSTVQSGELSAEDSSQMQSSVILIPIEKQTSPTASETLPILTEPAPLTEPSPQQTDALSDQPIPSGLLLLEFTDTVKKGNTATVTIKGKPDTVYSIKVKYSSGYSSAQGLEDQTSDSDGICSWTWRVGGSTKSGSYPITISDGTDSYELTFTVE
ncbi:MAG: hypothetical protein ACI3XR_03170 [Eubacteriales bacterium]